MQKSVLKIMNTLVMLEFQVRATLHRVTAQVALSPQAQDPRAIKVTAATAAVAVTMITAEGIELVRNLSSDLAHLKMLGGCCLDNIMPNSNLYKVSVGGDYVNTKYINY